MSRYEEIETFVQVVDAGSITAAADRIRVAKSAVSRRIKELEKRLGVQLLHRSSRNQTLTDTGQALYDRSVELLQDWVETEAVASSSTMNLAGKLKLSTPLSFGNAHLSPAILDFMRLHPDVQVDVDFTDRSVDLVAEGFDLTIRIGNLSDSSLIARKLASVCMVVVGSPDLVKRQRRLEHPDDLLDFEECVYGHRKTSSWYYKDMHGVEGSLNLKPRLFTTSGEFLRDATVAGEGILRIPRFIVYENLKDGSLVELLPDYDWGDLPLSAIYPPTKHLSPRVRAFIDFLVERFRGTPYWDLAIR
ncbi:MAG: LysR family transcriptional regulator [Pseudomonadota bacterium]